MSDPAPPPPPDPRSPRTSPSNTTPATANDAQSPPAAPPPPPIFLDGMPMTTQAAQYQRASSFQSLLMLTFFFFFFSGGGSGGSLGDISGENDAKAAELARVSSAVENYKLYLNGSSSTNYTAPPPLTPPFSHLLPPDLLSPSELPDSRHYHPGQHAQPARERESLLFYSNVTGFYRKGQVSVLNLTNPNYPVWSAAEAEPRTGKEKHRQGVLENLDKFWHHLLPASQHGSNNHTTQQPLPHIAAFVNTTAFNYTLGSEKRGTWEWAKVVGWEISIKEREIVERDEEGAIIVRGGEKDGKKEEEKEKETQARPLVVGGNGNRNGTYSDWAWVHSSLTWYTANRENSLTYDLTGVHHLPRGEFVFWGVPEDQPLDIRHIPALYANQTLRNTTGQIVLFDMLRQLKRARDSLGVIGGGGAGGVEDDDEGYTKEMLEVYEAELADPSGIPIVPPTSAGGLRMRMEGVAVFDGCGVAFGLHDGEGMRSGGNQSDMEATRTPSGLAKISFWSIGMMVASDSWMFSAHAVVAIMSDNNVSLPMLIPAFFSLCTAMIFGPRFGVMIHRVQAPENAVPEPTPTAPRNTGGQTGDSAQNTTPTPAPTAPSFSIMNVLRADMQRYPNLRWIVPAVIILFLLFSGIVPRATPIFLCALYSFWVPQIWRNARRGNRKALQWRFVIGQSLARLALPLYAFACPDNVFFLENNKWVWMLALWQILQIAMLYAQERFGPAFFLPARFAPPDAYDYHQPLPMPDSEAPEQDFGNCSICMEPIMVSQIPSASGDHKHAHSGETSTPLAAAASGVGTVGTRVMNINLRRTYALAPCHHLFHTECLSQWLAIKNTCPLCKRGLPPL
ncbi:hypothetical protein QFC21_003455 [Naganishia friedmannii]|uniref:Uncharacterized protein n=1 Tax=Naganishia friedmannii TaxID=89922 RepID=A0ACC2VR62_9TREE|nr:hypothetical protein QFC21_003455 [Naganishia friedmannii]